MKFASILLIIFLSILFQSCKQHTKYGEPDAEPATITKSLMSFLTYRDTSLKLYQDFTGINSSGNVIAKDSFLNLLSSGTYLPLKLKSNDATIYYQLIKLNDSVDNDIKTTIKYWGLQEEEYYKLEGKDFPDFKFVDINGNTYDNNSTRGKIVVFKCWFLDCLPCIKEIPLLNELRLKYINRNDILFISLCWDSKTEVQDFLKKKEFNYVTVPGQYKFLTDTLLVNAYPTHFVLNKDGKIVIKTEDYRALSYALKKLSSQ